MRGDVGCSFREPGGAEELGVCAFFCAGIELDLLSGRSVCSAADFPCRDGRGGCPAPAFEIAGGIILLLIGLDMLEAKRSPTQESREEAAEAALKEDAGIVPLGIPMLAGPGAITSVMVLVGQAQTRWQMVAILASIFITAAICYLVLGNSDRVARALGETGGRILVRIMGLLLVALAVQYFVNGMVDLGVIAKP